MLHIAFAVLSLSAFAPARPLAAQGIAPPVRTRVDYRVRPFVAMHFWVRDLASRSDAPPEIAGLEAAVLAARALDAELASPLAWGALEGLLGTCDSARAAREAFARVPETMELRGGGKVELRAGAVKLADALAVLESAYLEKVWPEHERALDAARTVIAEILTPQESVALEFHTRSLGFTDDGKSLPVYLVAKAPFPGAVTHRDDDGRGVCFVAVDGVAGSLLVETIVHELTHAFDVVDKGESVLARLRKMLAAQGITPRERAWRNVLHTLMFVQSGETVRRVLVPAHVHYGDAEGYYRKVATVADVELPIWKAHLDGKKTRDAALEEIVAGVLATRTGK